MSLGRRVLGDIEIETDILSTTDPTNTTNGSTTLPTAAGHIRQRQSPATDRAGQGDLDRFSDDSPGLDEDKRPRLGTALLEVEEQHLEVESLS